jgi:hypothetical protein
MKINCTGSTRHEARKAKEVKRIQYGKYSPKIKNIVSNGSESDEERNLEEDEGRVRKNKRIVCTLSN